MPSGEVYHCVSIYRNVPLRILKVDFPSDLYVLEMDDLDVIMGMDWLGEYKAVIECQTEKVSLTGPKGQKVTYCRVSNQQPRKPITNIISVLQIKKCLHQVLQTYLYYVHK